MRDEVPPAPRRASVAVNILTKEIHRMSTMTFDGFVKNWEESSIVFFSIAICLLIVITV